MDDNYTVIYFFQIDTPSLSGDQLDELLDQCARTMSRATAETDNLSQSSARLSANYSHIYFNTPYRAEPTLDVRI